MSQNNRRTEKSLNESKQHLNELSSEFMRDAAKRQRKQL